MTSTSPAYVLAYLTADLGAIAWLLYLITDELPHQALGMADGTLIYGLVGIVGVLSLGATLQHLDS